MTNERWVSRVDDSGDGTYLGVVRAVLFLVAVPADSVIVEAGIFDQSDPLAPPRRDVAAVVLVEVLAEEGCKVETRTEEFVSCTMTI